MQQSKTHHFFCQQQAAGPGRYGYDTTGALYEFKFLHVTCQFITGYIVRQRVARHLAALVEFPWVQHLEHAFFPFWKVVGLRLSRVSIFLQTIIISCSERRAAKARSPSSGGQIWSGKAIYAEQEGVDRQTEEGWEGGEAE